MVRGFALLVVLMLGFCGCAYVGKPNAYVDNKTLVLTVANLDSYPWKDCVVTINPKAKPEDRFTYNVALVNPDEKKNFIFTQFKKPSGDRFLPVMHEATDVEIKCKQPFFPASYKL